MSLGFLDIFLFLPLNIVFLLVGILLFFSSLFFVSGMCLFIYYTCLLLCLFWAFWVRENFSGGPGHIFPVWDSAVWSAGPVQFYLSTLLEWMAGLYRFFSSLALLGTVRLKWWGGGLFFSNSLVCCRAVVCGRILFFYIGFPWLYFGTICGFVCYELLILSYLLQVVEEEYGLGRL